MARDFLLPLDEHYCSELLGVSSEMLFWVKCRLFQGRAYSKFRVPKSKGGFRVIHSPRWDLAFVQSRIKERILDKAAELPECVTAFRKGVSIRDNALVHCNKAVVVKVDLQDFFPSVSLTRVIATFKACGIDEYAARSLGYLTTVPIEETMDSDASSVIASSRDEYYRRKNIDESLASVTQSARVAAANVRDLAERWEEFREISIKNIDREVESGAEGLYYVYSSIREVVENAGSLVPRKKRRRRGLPQGATTSPQLANLAACQLDFRLMGLADSLGFAYTRYADDLTFSSPDSMAKVNVLLRAIRTIVEDCGFRLNPGKTGIMRAPSTRRVTGLIVNSDTPKVPRAMIRKIRAMLHQRALGKLGDGDSERLLGYLAFVRMINPAQAALLGPDFTREDVGS